MRSFRVRAAPRSTCAPRWIESLAGDRGADLAELRAHHYLAALELGEASGGETAELVDPALDALLTAARRALILFAFSQAERYATRALELCPEDDARQPGVLFTLALAEAELGKAGFDARAAEAAHAFVALGDLESAARAETVAATWLWNFGQRDEAHAAARRAIALVEDASLSSVRPEALAAHARLLMLNGEYREAVDVSGAGLEAARKLGAEGTEGSLLITLGTARNGLGEGGLEDLEEGIAIVDRLNIPREFTRGHNNLAEQFVVEGDIVKAERHYEIALERMERLGIVQSVVWLLPQLAELAYHSGDWTKADALLARYARLLESMPGHYLDVQVGGLRARMASARAGAAAGELWEDALVSGRTVKDPQALVPTLSGYARFLLENGRREEATALLEEMNELSEYYAALIDLGWVLHALDRPDLMRSEARGGAWADAGTLVARGELAAAADLLGEKGLHTEEAYARLRAAETLTGAARAAQLEPAAAFYRSVGASSYVRRAEALLPATA